MRRRRPQQQIGTRVAAWWRVAVVTPVRRAWLAVARVRKGECGGKVLINLHQDVQTCGYQDVQVMWDMLSSDTTAGASTPKQRPFWPASSGATAAVAQ